MRKIVLVVMVLGCGAGLRAAITITGCVTDAAGKPVTGAKVFAEPERGSDKTYRAETRKSDGCYEMRVGKDGTYLFGVRDLRFADNGPVQWEVRVFGSQPLKVDLSTDVPNGKLLGERLTEGLLSASAGFSRVRSNRSSGSTVPAIMALIPSGFGTCMLQYRSDQNGPTAVLWCSTGGGYGGIRDESHARAIFEKLRDSIGATLANLDKLRYSPLKPSGDLCPDCVQRAVWASPINGVVSLNQTKFSKRNFVVLWVAYNATMAEAGCSSIQRNEEYRVDTARYDAIVQGMRDEYIAQLNAAVKAAFGGVLHAAVGVPNVWDSRPNSVGGGNAASGVSGNSCLTGLAVR